MSTLFANASSPWCKPWSLALVMIASLFCLPPISWADPIIDRHTSLARGDAWVFLNSAFLTSSSFISPLPPDWGAFVFSDSASATRDGATATVHASIDTLITSSGFQGSGAIAADSSQTAAAGATTRAVSNSQISFTLMTPHIYTYTGHFLLDPSGTYPFLTLYAVAGLSMLDAAEITEQSSIFFQQLAADGGPASSGTHTLTYSGVLAPGRYWLGGGVMSMFQTTSAEFPSARGRMAFDYAFTLAPAPSAPVPEPASLMLVAAGLAAAAGRGWTNRRRPSKTNDKGRT